MASLAVKLPLRQDSVNGFKMITDFKTLVKQNFKMLLLTSPGERIMEPSYGVGLRKYLFSSFDQGVFNTIEANIREQAKVYLPVITIQRIIFDASDIDANSLSAEIQYAIPTLNVQDLLEFTI
jgi:phage baseplate assembly protein W|tara:strand:+ start:171 stop:539 length:369 start_codon:yes stop_codon:yes gene_type:complete